MTNVRFPLMKLECITTITALIPIDRSKQEYFSRFRGSETVSISSMWRENKMNFLR